RLGHGKYERTSDHSRTTGQSFTFDTSLESPDGDALRPPLLKEIHVCACRREHPIAPNGSAFAFHVDRLDVPHRHDHVRYTGVHEMCPPHVIASCNFQI